MTEKVEKLYIVDNDNITIFDKRAYVIPLYQRAYAWGEKHIRQLIEDINDKESGVEYCLGSLVVAGNGREVIDGQQRLTTLFLLLKYLGYLDKEYGDENAELSFSCRIKSNYTLKHIKKLVECKGKLSDDIDWERVEHNIKHGYEDIEKAFRDFKINTKEFKEKLKRVVIYRIVVPAHTDLNRYFEIMNTRGEQLEQHDILKAKLMDGLSADDASAFAAVWEACSDMTGYIQMHFRSKDNTVRKALFGVDWDRCPSQSFEGIKIPEEKDSIEKQYRTLSGIIGSTDGNGEKKPETDEDWERVRFESVIEFPYFLLHTLKVFISVNGITHENSEEKIIPELLDEKKLTESFEGVIKHGIWYGHRISEDKMLFSKEFIVCLLRTRFLFDKYIIKREYASAESEGDWSLKTLEASKPDGGQKPRYLNTFKCDDDNGINKQNLMLQSALRVSYTSPKVMHWITNLLEKLYRSNGEMSGEMLLNEAEEIARNAVRSNFFENGGSSYTISGCDTPHIVFNYLDYLLWKQDRKADFAFEFRNSVEHWYPRNPSDGTFKQLEEGEVNRFGNLCLIQRRINSRFSNMSPEAKKTTFIEMIKKGSLKLRRMSEATNGDANWIEVACVKHEEEMLSLLREACYHTTGDKA